MINPDHTFSHVEVALFRRAWIEIISSKQSARQVPVAVFRRAWIEIDQLQLKILRMDVALFRRAWIEMYGVNYENLLSTCRSLQESVD